MRILLDTNALLWLVTGDDRAKDIVPDIEDPRNTVYYSAASIWEIAIKNQIGKLDIDPGDAREEFEAASFEELKISSRHAEKIMMIPMDPDHKDPFDRIILAQAMEEGAALITGDKKMTQYHYPNVILI